MIDLVELLEKIKPYVMGWSEASSGVTLGGITLYHAGTNGVYYTPDSAGLVAAIAASVSGDAIQLPAGTWSDDFTIPGGVTVLGMGRSTVLSGNITVNGHLYDVKMPGLITSPSTGQAFLIEYEANGTVFEKFFFNRQTFFEQGIKSGNLYVGHGTIGTSQICSAEDQDDVTVTQSAVIPGLGYGGRIDWIKHKNWAETSPGVFEEGTPDYIVNLYYGDVLVVQFHSVTGIKIGQSADQLLAFHGATPTVQCTTAINPAAFVQGSGQAVNEASTFGGYTLAQLAAVMIEKGLMA